MKQRLRITYAVDGPVRYASHLDQMRIWERTARRAGIQLSYSGGFNPRPRLQIAAALPVGFAAQRELLDAWLTEAMPPHAVRAALVQHVPPGLDVLDVEEVRADEPPLQTRVRAARYSALVETPQPAESLRLRVQELLAAPALPRQRRGRQYDLRPLVETLRVEEHRPHGLILSMALAAREGATGRPEEVLDALGLSGCFFRITRLELALESLPDERPGGRVREQS